MKEFFKELFRYETTYEQKNAGQWVEKRRYNKLLVFFVALIFVAALVSSAYFVLHQTREMPELPVIAETISEETVSDDVYEDESGLPDVSELLDWNQIWLRLSKKKSAALLYEKMDEGNKEIGSWEFAVHGDDNGKKISAASGLYKLESAGVSADKIILKIAGTDEIIYINASTDVSFVMEHLSHEMFIEIRN